MNRMTLAEYGAHLASFAPPLKEWQIEAAARILAGVADNGDGITRRERIT
ncbi:hypothetical protein GCM10027596_35840 [Nocardioides korecus]